ncbi:MAG: pyruvate kinase [Candidatus Omnitrophica bacterium]|nr:pyruvate kinase [Candidatus Omnitrophota bacterium]
MPKTRIIATTGPASASRSLLRKMMLAGMDVARLNFSHGNHYQHGQRIEVIRALNKKYRRHIRILQDLEGFRIRIGRLKSRQGILLRRGQKVLLTQKELLGEGNTVSFDYAGSLESVPTGAAVFIDDGNIQLEVLKRVRRGLQTVVVSGGTLRERKGVNIPGVRFPFRGLTDKDCRDLSFGIEKKVDYIAQSFVRDQDDIGQIREIVSGKLPACRIIAKIENEEGIRNLEGILRAADGIMIARGDMGVSLPVYRIPVLQKTIIKKCLKAGKMVITATQMLESMTEHPRPTRAEVSDVANALLDGSGYLMLSAETAAGKYPVESVRMMNDIIKYTEKAVRERLL